jgi:aldose 1-epimerase
MVIATGAQGLQLTIEPRRGMLGCSLRHRGEELLAGGGIPLLHPWANRLDAFEYTAAGRSVALDPRTQPLELEEHGLPIHGARTEGRWRALPAGAELDWAAHPDLLGVFPFPHRVRVEVELAASTATFRTTVVATGDVPVPLAFGHHPYLRVPEPDRAAWEVELPARAALGLDARGLPTGARAALPAERAPLGERTFDDLFAVGDGPEGAVSFAVAGGGRELRVRFGAGYPYAQVFSPPGGHFICFEPMTAPVNALRTGDGLRLLAPGATFTAEWQLEVA